MALEVRNAYEESYPVVSDCFPQQDFAELASSSVHLQAQDGQDGQDGIRWPAPYPSSSSEFFAIENNNGAAFAAEDSQGQYKDAIFQRLQKERVVLLCDLNSVKAKFELTLQTLRATLRLGPEATWADLLEHAEALADGHLGSNDGATAGTLADQADQEREALEEKVEAQQAHISRLRELLQKQQKLLDMTAGQIHDQHQKEKKQGEELQTLEQQSKSAQEIGQAQAAKIDALTAHTEKLTKELQVQRGTCAHLEAQFQAEAQQHRDDAARDAANFRREADKTEELQQLLASRDADVKRAKADYERQKAVIKELTDALASQNAAYDDMRDRLDVHESEHRRIHSYKARTPDNRISNCSYGGDVASPSRVSTSQISARGAMSARQELTNGSTTLAGYHGNPAASMRTGQAMDENERDAFLSQFPMAQRTERAMRNRMEGERRKKIGRAA